MKTAEEVVNAVIMQKNPKWGVPHCDEVSDWATLASELTEAMTTFAEERVKESCKFCTHDECQCQCECHDETEKGSTVKKACGEVLEEAAKIADGRKFYDPEGFLASAIRALKDKP